MTAGDMRPAVVVCLLVHEGESTSPACGDRLRGLAWAGDPDKTTCPSCRDTERWRTEWRERRAGE